MAPWRDALLTEKFLALTQLLQRHESLWRPRAFQLLTLPWEKDYPALATMLRALDIETAEKLASDDEVLAHQLQSVLPDAEKIIEYCRVPAIESTQQLKIYPEARAVPGRKWQQITAFAQCVPLSEKSLLEWCAGKAHLGRWLAQQRHCRVDALEWNAALVAEGQRLARREQLAVAMHCVDVLAPTVSDFVNADQCVVALHACGDLHVQLLHVCAQKKPHALTLAPCCYHLLARDDYQPLSNAAQRTRLSLTRDELRTAVQETVTAPARDQRQRKLLQSWRLGFDLMQREVRGCDEYLPTPSLPLSAVQRGFETVCRQLAASKRIELPATIDFAKFERAGGARLREVAALDLARVLFRRPLELWLILDRALYLKQSDYAVEIGTFCERQITPRNVLIRATRDE